MRLNMDPALLSLTMDPARLSLTTDLESGLSSMTSSRTTCLAHTSNKGSSKRGSSSLMRAPTKEDQGSSTHGPKKSRVSFAFFSRHFFFS